MTRGVAVRAGPAHARPGDGGAALLRGGVHRAHRRQDLPGRPVQGAGAGQVHQRLPGRRGQPGLPGAGRPGPLRRRPGDPPRAQPVRPDLRPRLPGLLRAASAAAARSTSRSPSAWSSASWPTRRSSSPGRPSASKPPKDAAGRRGRRRPGRPDRRPAPGAARLRGDRLREAARRRRHDDGRHPGVPPARASRSSPRSTTSSGPASRSAATRRWAATSRWTTCSIATASTPWSWPSAPTRAASWASPARRMSASSTAPTSCARSASSTGAWVERSAARAEHPAVVSGKRVAVVGGGDVAIDAARTAWRLGAKRGPRRSTAASARTCRPIAEEIEAAVDEGIQFHFLANPVKVLGDEHVTGVVLQRQRLGEFDNSGRRRPVPVDGDEFTLDLDVLIPAIGQTTDPSWMQRRPASRRPGPARSWSTRRWRPPGRASSRPATRSAVRRPWSRPSPRATWWPWRSIIGCKTGELRQAALRDRRAPTSPSCTTWTSTPTPRRPHVPELAVAERRGNFQRGRAGLRRAHGRARKPSAACAATWSGWTVMKLPRPAGDAETVHELERRPVTRWRS